jgi:hypothetical protein
MMNSHSIQYILQVFRAFRENQARGMPVPKSYQKAVKGVAQRHEIAYQTVGDGCRRRLGLNNINELYELLSAWVRGDSGGLIRQLKAKADSSTHAEIDQFFATIGSSTPLNQNVSIKDGTADEAEIVPLRLCVRDARMLRALAELAGTSAGELAAAVIVPHVRERMKTVARELVAESGNGDSVPSRQGTLSPLPARL